MKAEPLVSLDVVSAVRRSHGPAGGRDTSQSRLSSSLGETAGERRRTVGLILGGSALCLSLISSSAFSAAQTRGEAAPGAADIAQNLMTEPVRLAVAALIGLLVTALHRRSPQEPQARSMAHAQVLLCVSGALMMALISDSLARAFGIVGAASIIRFRTPVEDPKDAVVLFLLMALGMACGLGSYSLAGFGTAMLCAFLVALKDTPVPLPRSLLVELIATTGIFPTDHVHRVFARHHVTVEPREMSQGDPATAKFLATCAPDTSLEALNADLLLGGPSGLRAIAWEPAKKRWL